LAGTNGEMDILSYLPQRKPPALSLTVLARMNQEAYEFIALLGCFCTLLEDKQPQSPPPLFSLKKDYFSPDGWVLLSQK